MSAIKIFFGNYKGGVGKTTSTYNLAVEMAKSNKKILLVDLDPQSSLSEVCLRNHELNKQLDKLGDETLNYVYDIYMQARKMGNIRVKVDAKKIIKSVNGISIIPNSLFYKHGGLDAFSMAMGDNTEFLFVLSDFMEANRLDEQYDFIFFDCPPSNNIITQSAFLYSDYYIIPTIMDPLSTNGVVHYISVVENIYKKYCADEGKAMDSNADVCRLVFGDQPQLLGIFETMRNRNTDTTEYRKRLKARKYHLFTAEIKELKDVSDSIGVGKAESGSQYSVLAREVQERIGQMEAEKEHD